MENIYIFIVGILFLLAVSDLVVGVSNDAVNFLVSAVGSKAAPFWLIMAVASLGVIFGSTFSSGMMEVARKGIFHPDMFLFSEIMIVFLAVMLTDIILLDTFNSLGLPTSTTVSIVFELLGAAVAVAVIKTWGDNEAISGYINSSKALAIISGILLSVVVAFLVGAFVQYVARIIFAFENPKALKYFSAVWGGISVAFITYFILIKGLKGSSYADIMLANGETLAEWAKHSTTTILLYSFLAWTLILQLLQWLFKVNTLKFIVLIGTFALAMAFAGNDLVNFIGVPLAGLKSFELMQASGQAADMMTMEVLKEKVQTPTLYLILAGLVMVITLWVSRKAKSVTATSVNLSRQSEGYERFESNMLSRTLVRWAIQLNSVWEKLIPQKIQLALSKRFKRPELTEEQQKAAPAFDLIRASVNLVVASILISVGTSFKLPLSTTYVTFMVAMGTSLADGAWGRESAVYRISGVITVITGWFVTAFVAFSVAAIVATFIFLSHQAAEWAEWLSVIVMLVVAVYLLVRSQRVHRKREEADAKALEETLKQDEQDALTNQSLIIIDVLEKSRELLIPTIEALHNDDRKELRKIFATLSEIKEITKHLKAEVDTIMKQLNEEDFNKSHHYVQTIDYLREVSHSLQYIIKPALEHVDNNLRPISKEQYHDLMKIMSEIPDYFNKVIDSVKEEKNLDADPEMQAEKQRKILLIDEMRKSQLKRLKNRTDSTKTSMLTLNIYSEIKHMLLYLNSLSKSYGKLTND